jgi:hypothetical protein
MPSAQAVMRSCSSSERSGWVIETISTFSNWCWRSMPAVSLPALPASERKQSVWAVRRMGSTLSSRISPATVFVSVTSEVGISHQPFVVR